MADEKISGVAGVVVAGGLSRRMGRDKALINWRGAALISYPLRLFASFFEEVTIIAKNRRKYLHLGFPVHEDLADKRGALVGIYSGLQAVTRPSAFFAACDMPLISPGLVRLIVSEAAAGDWAVVPESPAGPEPLLALYSRKCLPAMEEMLASGDLRISSLFRRVPTRLIPAGTVRRVDPLLRSFVNLNTPEELLGLGSGDAREEAGG